MVCAVLIVVKKGLSVFHCSGEQNFVGGGFHSDGDCRSEATQLLLVVVVCCHSEGSLRLHSKKSTSFAKVLHGNEMRPLSPRLEAPPMG